MPSASVIAEAIAADAPYMARIRKALVTALAQLLDTYRHAAVTEREKGTYFEELILTYLRNEASYRDLYSRDWSYSDWAKAQGLDARDTAGIIR